MAFSFFSCLKSCKKNSNEDGEFDTAENFNNSNLVREVQIFGHAEMGNSEYGLQDSYQILNDFVLDCHYFSVIDAHGPKGEEFHANLRDLIEENIDKYIYKIEKMTDKELTLLQKSIIEKVEKPLRDEKEKYGNTGACLLSVMIQKNKCFITHIGNCRAIIGGQPILEIPFRELTQEHTSKRRDELKRVMESGGEVMKIRENGKGIGPDRVWIDKNGPGLGFTRALGDFDFKQIISSEPEVIRIDLCPYDQFMVIATDGLWQVMASDEVWRMVLQTNDKSSIAETLVQEARKRWEKILNERKQVLQVNDIVGTEKIIDDIAVVVSFFYYQVDEELIGGKYN